MKIQFQKSEVTCLDRCLWEVQNAEETLEIRLPEGMPDIGTVLCAWGQPILRSKEWNKDTVSLACGMMVWVAYLPEDGSRQRCLEGWIPFQFRWDLPQDSREGVIRTELRTRFVDARSTSPRKIMVRGGLAALGEALSPYTAAVFTPGKEENRVQLLRRTYPMLLLKEAGEKSFLIQEDLTLPGSAPQPDKLLYCCLSPEITDQKLLGNKVAFRGNGNLHLVYSGEDGQLHSWDFPLAFSQYKELEETYGSASQADVKLAVTLLELMVDDEGAFRLKCSITGQYTVMDTANVDLVTDAYLPGAQLEISRQELRLPVILDRCRETVQADVKLNAEADIVVEGTVCMDWPKQRRADGGLRLEFPGMAELLYYDREGHLRSASARFEQPLSVKAGENVSLCTALIPGKEPQVMTGADSTELRFQQTVEITALGRTEIPMILSIEPGAEPEPDPGTPALVLKRAGGEGLWELAKSTGSTVELIKAANDLSAEPEPGRLLLIPMVR